MLIRCIRIAFVFVQFRKCYGIMGSRSHGSPDNALWLSSFLPSGTIPRCNLGLHITSKGVFGAFHWTLGDSTKDRSGTYLVPTVALSSMWLENENSPEEAETSLQHFCHRKKSAFFEGSLVNKDSVLLFIFTISGVQFIMF